MRPRDRILQSFQARVVEAGPIVVPTIAQTLRSWAQEVLNLLVDAVPTRLTSEGSQIHKDGDYLEAVCTGTTHTDHPCKVTIAMLVSAASGELRVHLYVEEPQQEKPHEQQWVLKSDDSTAHLAELITKELHDV